MSFAANKQAREASRETNDEVDRRRETSSGRGHGSTQRRFVEAQNIRGSSEASGFMDQDSSEWLSAWGEAPRGAHEGEKPGWRGGGLAVNKVAPNKKQTKASRPAPVTVVLTGRNPSIGSGAVERALRVWLIQNRTLHEPRRMTLIRILGTGLAERGTENDDENGTERNESDEPDEPGNSADVSSKKYTPGNNRIRYVNGIPLDGNGRPVGVVATFPDPQYAAVDKFGKPSPLTERKEFIPKPMPPAKRSYHPQSSPFGYKRSDGTWDGVETNPRDTDPRDANDVALGKKHKNAPAVTLTKTQFVKACDLIGIRVSEQDVNELFQKRTTRPGGKVLELEHFVDTVLAAPERQKGDGTAGSVAVAVAQAARRKGEGFEKPPSAFSGKISYAPCKSGVFPPSRWDSDFELVSAAPPDVSSTLEWAYGVSVAGVGHLLQNCDTNATKTNDRASSRWAYAVGAMGVVFDAAKHTQGFFRGHDDAVVSLAVHPSGKWAATGQQGRAPCVCVWDTSTFREVARLRHAPGDRAVIGIAFGPGEGAVGDPCATKASPARIVTTAADATHCVRVWDWGGVYAGRTRPYEIQRAPGRGGGGISSLISPRVRGVAFAPDADTFATFGEGHVKVWSAKTPTDATATPVIRPQGGAAAKAAEAARAKAFANAAALPGGAATASAGYAARSFSVGGPKSATPDATCGAFAPGPGKGGTGLLVTGHADGRVRLWHGDALVCVGEKNAHGAGEPIRTLALFHDEDKRLTVVTGGGDGYVRRWSLFATEDGDTDSGAAVRSVGATRVSGNEPISASCFGFESAVGSKTTVRAVSIDANGVAAAVTSSGDLWIEQVWKEEVVDTNDTREGVATHARQSRVGDETEEHEEDADGKNEQDATPGSPEPTKSEPTKSKSGVFACFSRGQPSAAHCVAWHPNDTRGLFAVAGGGSRVVVYSAKQKKTIAVVWAVDPAPAKITSLAFAPDPAPEKFPEQYDTEEKGGLLLALGTADGFVRLVRLRLDTVGTATGNTDDAKTTGTTDPLAEKISSQTHVSYAARTVACVRSSPSGSAVTSLVFSPNGSRVAAAAEHLVVLHRVVGVSAGGAQGTQDGWFPHKTVCKGHRSSIQSVDWSVDGTVIRTTCRAREILHFESTQGRQGTCWGFPKSASLFCRSSARNYGSLHKSQVDNFPIHGTCTLKTDTFRVTTQAFGDFRDAEWHAWTAPLGFPVMGLFPCGITPTTQMGGDEINSVDRCDVSRGDGSLTHESMTHDNTDSLSLVATGDDFGRVRLFKYPCVVSNDRNARTEMFAHAQHVSCVRFAPELVEAVSTDTNSRLLVSTGGADRAALQWVVTSASREGDDSDEVGGGITTADSAMVAEIEPSTSTSQSNHQPPAQKIGLYRQSKLKELESRVSDLLNAARPKPPQRRLKPWLAKPAIAVRSVDSSRIPTGPRRPDTPPDNGEVLAFKDGEFYWQTPPSPRDFAKEFRK